VGTIDESPIQVGPKDAFSWGARLGFNLTPNVEVGGLFNLQKTDLEASGLINRSVPQSISNYHGYFAYNFGDPDASARPYLLGGLGATQYGSLTTGLGEIGGETQFSTTWAAGVKIFPGRNFGLRLEGRWTPTYIKSDPEGYWCDPWWGCYTVSEAEFSNQYELSGGIILRF
jgi:opacity protein-like surface antigen